MKMAFRMNRLVMYKVLFSLLLGLLSFLGIYASLKINLALRYFKWVASTLAPKELEIVI